jgi:hypothetical protein
MNSISSVACVINQYLSVSPLNTTQGEKLYYFQVKIRWTHAEHAPHPKSLDLLETPKGFFDQAFDERIEHPVEEWWGHFVDLCVHADEVQ